MTFSTGFLSVLIIVSLVGISVGVIALLILLYKDIKSKELW